MDLRKAIFFIAAFVAVLVAGCESPFTPKGTYEDKMVVYGILSNRSDSQYVRVYLTYDPGGFDPLAHSQETMIRGAQVTMSDSSGQFSFRECVVPREDKSRYSDDLVAYVSYPFRVALGNTYNLTVTSAQYGTVTGSVVVPRRGRVQILNAYILSGGGANDEDIVVFGWIKELTYGVFGRLYLVYETLEGEKWVRHVDEMPSTVAEFDDGTRTFGYPTLRRRETLGIVPGKELNERFIFSRKAYVYRLGELTGRYPAGRLRIRYGLAVVTQVDQGLYTYAKLAHAFEDPYSIRTDMPDFTNIAGGQGVFGSMVEDSAMAEITL